LGEEVGEHREADDPETDRDEDASASFLHGGGTGLDAIDGGLLGTGHGDRRP
jgi:hypothetical protein